MKVLKPSKNIHASTSRIHWWKKVVTGLFLLFAITSAIWAEEFNQLSTFLQHIKGWEWVYMEEGHTKQIKTPYYSVTYKEFDSHPEYKIVIWADNRYDGLNTYLTVYDTNGKLIRQLTEVSGWFKSSKVKEESCFINNKDLYHIAHGDKIISSLTKLSSFYPKMPVSDEYLLQNKYNYRYALGRIQKIKKKDTQIIDELNSQIRDQHMQIIVDNNDLYCHFDSTYADSLYIKACRNRFSSGFTPGLYIKSPNNRDKRIPINFGSSEKKQLIIDSLCHRQMVTDYLNNMYDVKTKENAETLKVIEQALGIQNNTKEHTSDSSASDVSVSSENAAYEYLSFLRNEYEFIVTNLKRIDAITFEAIIEIAPRGSVHKIIIFYQQKNPYECEKVIQLVS